MPDQRAEINRLLKLMKLADEWHVVEPNHGEECSEIHRGKVTVAGAGARLLYHSDVR